MSTDIAVLIATGEGQMLEPDGDVLSILKRMRGRATYHAFQFDKKGEEHVSESSQKGTLPLEPCRSVILYAVDQNDLLNTSWRLLQAPDFQGAIIGEFPQWKEHLALIPSAASKHNNPAVTFLWSLQKIVLGKKGPAKAVLEAIELLKSPSIGALHNRGSNDVYIWDTMERMRFVEVEGIHIYYTFPLPGLSDLAEQVEMNNVFSVDLLTGKSSSEGKLETKGFIAPEEPVEDDVPETEEITEEIIIDEDLGETSVDDDSMIRK